MSPSTASSQRMRAPAPMGLCVISVWESKAHADRFTAELLVPTLQRLGVTPDQRTRRSVLEIDLDDASSYPRSSPTSATV
jgi:hypothetical protein